MNRPLRFVRRLAPYCALASIAAILAALLPGCQADAPHKPTIRYPTIAKRAVPKFMEGTIYELTDLGNDSPFLVSGWGLVVNLNGTGGSRDVSNNVKAYMVKQLEANGFGSKLVPQYEKITPEAILLDKNAAIVGVYGWIPPGARQGQWFDVVVNADRQEVASLARGTLYRTDLTVDGANRTNPVGRVNVFARCAGPVFVNPAVVLQSSEHPDAAAKRSLRTGVIMAGAQVTNDRALMLRLRQPQWRLSRSLETRINDYFRQDGVARAHDEGICQIWVPPQYHGDWEHFSKLVMHVYLQGGSEAFARSKARSLGEEAMKPNAPLQDISYCWEGLGAFALPALAPMLSDEKTPSDVRFAAARAAAYIGDPSGAARRALYDIATDSRSPFQLAAVQVLGRIPNSNAVNHLLRDLVDSDQTMVRIEAYNILASNRDPSVQTQAVAPADHPEAEKFLLDFVHSRGQPMIYATRSGLPRIAIFGDVPDLALPVTFTALGNRLMIASGAVGRDVTIFYRDQQLPSPVQMSSQPDVAALVSRLAGATDDGTGSLEFTYAEILAILQGLSDQHKLRVTRPTGEEMAAAFVLQDVPEVRDAIDSAPSLERGRPQGDVNAPKLDAPAQPAQPVGKTDSPAAVDTASAVGRQ